MVGGAWEVCCFGSDGWRRNRLFSKDIPSEWGQEVADVRPVGPDVMRCDDDSLSGWARGAYKSSG
jgi:hypothetical protein